MSTARQSTANRANAQRSSGPKSAAGKRKVSQNARRHGLATPPPWDLVTRWYRIITGDVQSRPDPTRQDQREQAAIRLAAAEAQLERTSIAERAHLLDGVQQQGLTASDPCRVERVIARLKQPKPDLDD